MGLLSNSWHSGDKYAPLNQKSQLLRAHWYFISHLWPSPQQKVHPAHRTSKGELTLHGVYRVEGAPSPVLVPQEALSSRDALQTFIAVLKPMAEAESSSDDELLSARVNRKGRRARAVMPLAEFIVPDGYESSSS